MRNGNQRRFLLHEVKEMKRRIDIYRHGVYPVHSNVFKIGIAGRTSTAGDIVTIKDIETFSPSIDGVVQEWSPMDQLGWIRRAVTGKGLKLTLSGKRSFGDPGNDYVAGLATLLGSSVETIFQWTLPNGSTLHFDCVVNVMSFGGGESTDIDALEIEVLSDGAPAYTSTSVAALTFVCSDGTAAGATKIAAVSPVLTGGSSYVYKINGSIPVYDTAVDATWTAYTIGADIIVTNGNLITLLEIDASSKVKKGGTSAAVVV